MNARYENDPSRPGYGIFVVNGVETSGSETIRYTLQRARDHKSLHPHGWEDSACALEPDAVAVENNALRLFVGPNVVAQLDELDTYRFLVHAADGTQRATLELAGIVYPSHVRSGSVAAPEVIRTSPPVVEPAPTQESRPPEEEETAPASLPERLELDSGLSPSLAETTANAARPRHSRILLAALLVALLAIAGGAALWSFMQDNAPESALTAGPDTTPATPQDEKAAPGDPTSPLGQPGQTPQESLPPHEAPGSGHAAEGGAEPLPADPVRPPSPLDQARALLRDNASPAQALDLARRLVNDAEADGTAGDAAFLLFETAAEGGQPEAMLRLGGFYDPGETAPRGRILPDAEQAWFWYGKAHEAGLSEAAQRKAALRARLETEAAAGSTEARALLERLH